MNNKQNTGEFSELADLLANTEMDGSAYRERIFNRLKSKLESGAIQANYIQGSGIHMKKNKWKAVAVSAAAVICLCGIFSTTSYAQDMIQSILARFQVGNMVITQYDKELPAAEVNKGAAQEQSARSERPQREAPKNMSLQDARKATGIAFPAPAWLSEHYQLANCVVQGDHMIEVQYKKDSEFMSLLISKGGNNGIGTTGEVKKEAIGGTTVYFANGIVLWEHDGFTYELYQMTEKDFDNETLGKIITSLSSK
ncbi:hypothetical protein [Paenibacillus thalictri]|uniref:DUF4367 domain-containing protein n=1 Tax=Paenibacillus thalictri TaxID=2527873 RepID=A0A4V2J3N9_9BACL|nr:hypothetical protein [Paenibacillus thalictri]TBL74512.1 hypothetical protein EYB31_24600 [Paenibacillus thalictri]